MLDERTPFHCADEYDERSWATDGVCSDAFHSLVAEATLALTSWISQVLGALQVSRVGPVHFPATTGRALSGHGQVLDPSLTYLLLCLARRDAEPVNTIYIGLITRDPATRWRGLTGFYLPFCGTCDPDPFTTAQRIVDWLPEDAVVQTPARLPAPLRPSPGWFEGRMLLGVHLPSPVGSGIDADWSVWPHERSAPSGPALACIGSLETGLHNLLYLDNAKTDLPALGRAIVEWKRTGVGNPLITYRCGDRVNLLILGGGIRSSRAPAGVVSRAVLTGLARADAPVDWGVLVITDRKGRTRARTCSNLRQGVRTVRTRYLPQAAGPLATFHSWASGDGIITFRHLRRLARWAEKV